METTKHPWLDRLKHHLSAVPEVENAGESDLETAMTPTDKTDNTLLADSFVGFVGASSDAQDDEIAWRVAAFRTRIPVGGPIWPPQVRQTPLCDMPDHCSLCGDELPSDPVPRFRRCQHCIRALWLALNSPSGACAPLSHNTNINMEGSIRL
jgi:hypothetical protein